ncbi:hypothetical protein E2C01_004285 [Portunus trituberculatus]|uniref:Uncharacterized protein n=1 Tax=Portunus trituberculatus TaxID=210409 RepID=A0A5B7CTM6_PORTR|nr:hypothetical protein [Portunus trituberculatus]
MMEFAKSNKIVLVPIFTRPRCLSEEQREVQKVVVGAGSWDNDSGHILDTVLGVDPGLAMACTVHTDFRGEEGNPGHRQDLMGVDSQAEHWVLVLHTQDGFQEVEDKSHMAEDKVALLGTDQEEGTPLGNLVGTDWVDMADGTPGLL